MPFFLMVPLVVVAGLVGWRESVQPLSVVATTVSATVASPEPVLLPPLPVASSYVVLDATTGVVVASKDAETVRPLASVTKLFTAAAVLDDERLLATTSVTDADLVLEGEAGDLAVGQRYTGHELLFPLLLVSSNDAGAVLERVYGEALYERMTHEAGGIRFADTTGLAAANAATARAVAEATAALWQTKRHLFDITTLPGYKNAYTAFYNNNPAASLPGYLGGKHGYTPAAGKTVVAVFTETVADAERPYIYVLLDTPDIAESLTTLRAAVGAHATSRI